MEVDETYLGGKRRNVSNTKRKTLEGRGTAGKTAVVGLKDRASNQVSAKVVEKTDAETLQGFVIDRADPGATVYKSLPFPHESVKHSVGEYVKDRAHKGTFHKISPKHLDRYVQEFAGKHNMRDSGTLAQMRDTVIRLVGRNLLYRDLITDNGFASGARS